MKTIIRRIIADFVFPVENKPGILQLVTRIVPANYSIFSMDYICKTSGCRRP